MPINMSCPSCGKTLAAPDSAAGKKAKCPSCSQIMIVPAAPEAEMGGVAAPPSPTSLSPPLPSDGNWLDDLGGASRAPQAAATDAGGAERRPCPECGEMIIAGAAKCRFCGAVFDPRLKRSTTGAPKNQKGFAITSMVLGIISMVTGCIGIAVGIAAAVFGGIALNGMKRSGISDGRGMAIAGITLGIIAVIGWTILYIVIFTVFSNMQHNMPPPRFH